jgi:3,4-dihydroxy-2-butanone 4-phosphate synthase
VICEIVNEDGTMARMPDLVRFCKRHSLIMISVEDLASYRKEAEVRGSYQAMSATGPRDSR